MELDADEKDEAAPDELKTIYRGCLKRFVFIILINSVLCIALMSIMLYWGQPIIADIVPPRWVRPVTALAGLVLCSPFLWMLLRGGSDTPEIDRLWDSGPRWRVRLTAYGVLRILIAAVFVSSIVDYAVPWRSWLGIFALVAILLAIYFSSVLKKQGDIIEKNFTDNLSAREKLKK